MKRILVILGWLICWLAIFSSNISAKIFTPESELFDSELDGAWEFGEVMQTEFVGTEHASLLFTLLNQEITLNSSAEAKYLVANQFSSKFTVDQTQDIWLELTYQPWSQETEIGFDDPVLVVFLNDQIVLKRNIFEICCQPQMEKIYLGSLTGEQTLFIFAGDTGDLLKPSGVILQTVKIFGQSLLIDDQIKIDKVTQTEETTQISGSPTEIQWNKPISKPDLVITDVSESSNGQILGAEDKNSSSNSDEWQQQLKQLIQQPWLVWVMWPVLAGLIWLVVKDKNRYVTDNVSFRFKNISNSKKINKKG